MKLKVEDIETIKFRAWSKGFWTGLLVAGIVFAVFLAVH
jgi:hypothetical protein